MKRGKTDVSFDLSGLSHERKPAKGAGRQRQVQYRHWDVWTWILVIVVVVAVLVWWMKKKGKKSDGGMPDANIPMGGGTSGGQMGGGV